MIRERALKVVLVVVGLLLSGGIYLLVKSLSQPMEPELELGQMFLSIYITLGIFLLLAVRNPSANRSLIAFAGWSSLAHAAVMAVQAVYLAHERTHLVTGTIIFGLMGVALVVLAPTKQSGERASAASA